MHPIDMYEIPENYESVPQRMRDRESLIDTTRSDILFTVTGDNVRSVDLWVMDSIDVRSMIFMTALDELNATPLSEPHSIVALFASALICVFPLLAPKVKLVLNQSGVNIREVKLPSQAGLHFIEEMNRSTPESYVAVLGAQLTIMLIKNLSDANYSRLMPGWTEGLAESIGSPADSRIFTAIAEFEKVKLIRRIFAYNWDLKACMMRDIISYCELPAPISNVFEYLALILKYQGISSFTIIGDALLTVKSPVLFHPKVRHEVDCLADAFYALYQSECPQYFRLLARPSIGQLFERSRFPILLTVSLLIKQATSPNLSHFVAPRDKENPIVLELLELHNRVISERNVNANSVGNMEATSTENAQSESGQQSGRASQQPSPQVN